jgi:DNA methylase N-4/N-6
MNNLLIGDCKTILPTLETKSVQCCVTSPPYFSLRDYGVAGQIGQEDTVEEYVKNLVDIFHEVKRVLKDDGTLWLNLGDSYAGSGKARTKEGVSANIDKNCKQSTHKGSLQGVIHKTPLSGYLKPKDLIGVPWRVAFALQQDGWYLRQDIIWHKPNVMPESVKDRCVKSHEYIFLLSKSKSYYFDYKSIQENSVLFENRLPGIVRNREYDYNSKLNAMHTKYNLRRDDKRDRIKQVYAQKRLNRKDCNYDIHKRNKRDVWTVNTHPYTGAHFAVFSTELIIPCLLAGSKEGDTILDPFFGSGTTAEVATLLNRNWIGIELNPEYKSLYRERLGLFA